MKQLTKEQLTQLVEDTMIKVYEANAENIEKDIGSIENANDPNAVIGRSLAICMAEVMKECNQVLIETLYDILYTDQ